MLTCHWELANIWPRYCTSSSLKMFVFILMTSAEISRETTTYSQLATKNVSAIAPAETTFDWPNTVTWTVSNTACATRVHLLQHREHTILLSRERVNRVNKGTNSSPVVISYLTRMYWETMMQGWYYVESLTGQWHDRVQTESQIATVDSCFDLIGSLQHGVASCEVCS